MITAIRATSRTLADYLQSQFEQDPDLGASFSGAGSLRVYLNTPAEMTGSRAGLSVWLYRVTRDDATLNRPPTRVSPTLVRQPPFPARLHYLVAPITSSTAVDAPETEQVILGKAIQALHDHPQLRGTDLKDDLRGTAATLTTRFEALTIDELARIWDALATSYRTSVSYEVTVTEVDLPTVEHSGPPVEVPVVASAVIVAGVGS